MTEFRDAAPALDVRGLNVFYGASHALQGVDLTLQNGVLSVVGRNGMGKTTLCKTIMGLLPVASGSVSIFGKPIPKGDAGAVARLGVGYVPQGRRLWKSLSVDEHLRMLERPGGSWSAARVYEVFPRLAERKGNGAAQLSGGEQQMLAIARALLQNPQLLIMDEPTEGLAPVIVDQVAELLISLAAQREMHILVIEQNIRVATAVSDQVAIMLNGKINRLIDSTRLAADTALQQALLGVGRHHEDEDEEAADAANTATGKKTEGPGLLYVVNPDQPRRWSRQLTLAEMRRKARPQTVTEAPKLPKAAALIRPQPVGHSGRPVLVAGTMDTKARELRYVRDILRRRGLAVRLADLSLQSTVSGADIPAHEIALMGLADHRPLGERVSQMAESFAQYVRNRSDIAGMIALGGSGGSALAAPALQALPLGVPKVLVTTMAAGDVSPLVGASDVTIMPAVADIHGLNRITRSVLANAAEALAGMVIARSESRAEPERPAAALTMFGITTPCVQAVARGLEDHFEPIVFHATGTGGRSMETLASEGQLRAVYDLTTTEVADHVVGGLLSAGGQRMDVFSRISVPYIGSCGALDAVNFGAPEIVPARFQDRVLYRHNPNVTLMRVSAEEARQIGAFIAQKLNAMSGPVRFLLPEGGLSSLDRPGGEFEDKTANEVLFEAIEKGTSQSGDRQVRRIAEHINAPGFARAVLAAGQEIARSGAGADKGKRHV